VLSQAEAPVTLDALKSAMLAAAAPPSARDGSAYLTPGVRVDPNEKNLDRAWTRSFAWAIASDRSFFGDPPLGSARFVLTLAENGAIHKLDWLTPNVPARLKSLVLRMLKLLSRNRFNGPHPDGTEAWRRAFQMKVSEARVSVPAEAGATRGEAGELWMLGSGEIPVPGQPSQPMVADMTGHQLKCELSILDAPHPPSGSDAR
jgi:hypothetical protein